MNNSKLNATPSKGYRIALYIRVSTEEQAENPEGSIRNQEDRLRQAVHYKNQMALFGDIVTVYTDAGISAKDMKRPALLDMLRSVKRHEINLVMVTELSRLSRNTRDFIQMWDMMKDHHCKFQSLREDFDTTTSTGELILFQLMNLAQFERRQTSERVEANMATRAARGLYNGGSIPLGYKRIPERPGYLAIDEEMAKTTQLAFDTFLKEGSLAATCLWMNGRNHKIKRCMEGGGRYTRVGHFTVSNLQAILRNKAYLGIKCYTHKNEKKECQAVWPAIVDNITFQRANELLDKNYRKYKPHKHNKLPYYLTGITQCMTCKNPMSGKSATGNGGKVGYYEHVWATKRDSTLTQKIFKCEPHRVPAKKLEPLVLNQLNEIILNPLFIKKILDKVKQKHEANPHKKDMERLKAKLCGTSSQLLGLAERLSELPKTISAAPIYEQMEKLTSIKHSHEKEIQALQKGSKSSFQRVVQLETFEAFANHYQHILNHELSVTQRKQILQKFIRKVEVGTESVNIHYIVDQDHFEDESKLLAKPNDRNNPMLKNVENNGSNTLTSGARGRN